MRIEDRIALGYAPESALADVDHDALVLAKSQGTQLLAASGGKAVRDGEVYWFTLSTEEPNRRGDIIRQSGLDFRNWERTPVVLHNHDDELPVGMGTIRRNATTTEMGVQFSTKNPRAVLLKAMLDEGMPMAASIAILPKKVGDPRSSDERQRLGLGKYGVVYEASEVIEGSVVTVPADPAAVRNALRSAHVADDADVDRFVATMAATEMDMAKRLRAGAPVPDAPAWLPRFESALDRCAARIEHAIRGGFKREPEGSDAPKPSAVDGINLASLLSDLTKKVEARTARKD